VHFIDEVTIRLSAGDGGKGAVAFRREKFVPKGGPSGGDGGDGGSIVLVVDEGLSTLLDFRYKSEFLAPAGEPGANKDRYGKGGEDIVLRVPPGTQVFDDGNGTLIADLQTDGQRFVAAQGGKGGRGNIHFATSTDRAPRRAEPGTPGQERTIRLELKLLADVGLLGFPNVGKSSLIARISAARPKIADYPFTTLVPNLGTVGLSDDRSFVVADIPGLIQGAHAGAGLGDRFLRHLERTRVLVHIIDAASGDPERAPLADFDATNRELSLYDPELAKRPQIVALNKMDLPDVRRRARQISASFAKRGIVLYPISAATGEGAEQLLEAVWKALPPRGAARARADDAGLAAGDVRRAAETPETPKIDRT
jgi:GTPase